MLLRVLLWGVLLMAVIVLQQGDGEYAELMRIQEQRLNKWCCEMGYEMLRIYGRQRPAEPARTGYWEKPWVIRDVLQNEGLKGGDILFFIEPDVLLLDLKVKVIETLGNADMAMVWRTDLGIGPPRNYQHFCTGVQIMRVGPVICDLYNRLWEQGPLDRVWQGDCAAFNAVLGVEDYWPNGVGGDEASQIVHKRWQIDIKPLPMVWNLHQQPQGSSLEMIDGAHCVHWSNMPKSTVRRRMKMWVQHLEKEGR